MRLRRLQIEESDAADEQKRVERQRLNALVALCEAPRCRRQTLLAYFGETTEPCGNCDLCIDGVMSFDGTIEAQKILSAIVRTGERFGTEHLISILVGENTDSVRRFGHDKLKTFGVGNDRSKNEWRSLLRQIYAAGLISLELAEYGRWTLTERDEQPYTTQGDVSEARGADPSTTSAAFATLREMDFLRKAGRDPETRRERWAIMEADAVDKALEAEATTGSAA